MKTTKTNKKKNHLSTHKLKTRQFGITFAGTGSLLETVRCYSKSRVVISE